MLSYIRNPKDKYILRGKEKKVRLTQGMVSASRILRPVVFVREGDLLGGAEVYESIESRETIGTLLINAGGDIPQAYRVATLTCCLGDSLDVSKWIESDHWGPLCCNYRVKDADGEKILLDVRKKACEHLGLPESVIPTVGNAMLGQDDLHDLCGLLRAHGIKIDTVALEIEIRAGRLKFTPALAEFGVIDPAVTDRRERHDEEVCQPLIPTLLHMMHLLRLSPHHLDRIKALAGTAYRKGFMQPHLTVGLAIYRYGLAQEAEARTALSPFLSSILGGVPVQLLTPASNTVLQIAGALAVACSQAGTLDDHSRMLHAALPDWDRRSEMLPA